MQPRHYATEFCEHVDLFIKQRKPNYGKNMVMWTDAIRKHGVHFVVPEQATTKEVKDYDISEYGALRPPYSVTVLEHDFEFSDGDKWPTVIVAMDHPDQELLLWTYSVKEPVPGKKYSAWRMPTFTWEIPYKHCGKFDENGNAQLPMVPRYVASTTLAEELAANSDLSMDDYTVALADSSVYFMEIYAGFCALLAQREVTFEDVEPHKGRNKMRRALGKVPLFSYKVLTIGKKKPKTRQLGGTHASPRSHLRRGHYRTAPKSGRRYWVEPCMVKGETPGFVHKDYRVEGDAA